MASQDRPGPILLYFLNEAILDTFFVWSLSCPEYASELKYHQLRCFEFLLSRSQHELLFHKQFVRSALPSLPSLDCFSSAFQFKPLLNLLRSCESSSSLDLIEKHMIVVLNQVGFPCDRNEVNDVSFRYASVSRRVPSYWNSASISVLNMVHLALSSSHFWFPSFIAMDLLVGSADLPLSFTDCQKRSVSIESIDDLHNGMFTFRCTVSTGYHNRWDQWKTEEEEEWRMFGWSSSFFFSSALFCDWLVCLHRIFALRV